MALDRDYHRHSKRVTSTARWRALRAAVLERDGWKCVDCGKPGALEIDHIQPVRDAPHLAFDPANCAARCKVCHSRKTRMEVGHRPAPQDRLDWRKSVLSLEREGKKPIKQKGKTHA